MYHQSKLFLHINIIFKLIMQYEKVNITQYGVLWKGNFGGVATIRSTLLVGIIKKRRKILSI